MFEIMELPPQHERNSLRFDEGLTARATESRKHGHSMLPELKINEHSLSSQAQALYELLKGDGSQVRFLASCLADAMDGNPAFMSWKLHGRAFQFAQIVIYQFIGRPVSIQFAAQLMGITTRSYRASWMHAERFEAVSYYLMCWKNELKKA